MQRYVERIINILTVFIYICLGICLLVVPMFEGIKLCTEHVVTLRYVLTTIIKLVILANVVPLVLALNLMIKMVIEIIINKKENKNYVKNRKQ